MRDVPGGGEGGKSVGKEMREESGGEHQLWKEKRHVKKDR
jgi:hypothetical protein